MPTENLRKKILKNNMLAKRSRLAIAIILVFCMKNSSFVSSGDQRTVPFSTSPRTRIFFS